MSWAIDDEHGNVLTVGLEHALGEGEALVIGEHQFYGGCTYVVTSGSCDLSDEDTDGDCGGAGWPEPPAEILAEARAIAASWEGV